jgi:hypothetical protein
VKDPMFMFRTEEPADGVEEELDVVMGSPRQPEGATGIEENEVSVDD